MIIIISTVLVSVCIRSGFLLLLFFFVPNIFISNTIMSLALKKIVKDKQYPECELLFSLFIYAIIILLVAIERDNKITYIRHK